jgi:hypothetical protein
LQQVTHGLLASYGPSSASKSTLPSQPSPALPPCRPLQALRYESCDDSRLARFLVERAQRSVALACFLFWYLCTELDDPTFGPRASFVQVWCSAPYPQCMHLLLHAVCAACLPIFKQHFAG